MARRGAHSSAILVPPLRIAWSGTPPCKASVPALDGGQWCLSVQQVSPDHGLSRWIWIVAHSEDARIGRHGCAHGPDLARCAAEAAAARLGSLHGLARSAR